MSFETVKYELNETMATITMNRPEALNALSLQLTKDLRAAIEQAIADKARAVVLTGEGRAFCSGGDLREMQSMWQKEGRIEAFLEEPLKALHDVILLIRETPIPFRRRRARRLRGRGNEFRACLRFDFRGGKRDVLTKHLCASVYRPTAAAVSFCRAPIGEKLAAEIFMTGETLSAERALQIGMINRVVPAENLMKETMAMAQKLALAPTGSIGRIKQMLNATFSNDLSQQLDLEHECQIESGKSNDFKEGVQAFFEKRQPNFTGT